MTFTSPVLFCFVFSIFTVVLFWWPLSAWEPSYAFLNQEIHIQQNRRYLAINWLWRGLKLPACLREYCIPPEQSQAAVLWRFAGREWYGRFWLRDIDIAWVMGFVPLYYLQNPKLKITYDFCHYPFNENYGLWLWTEILLSKLRRINSLYTGIPITVETWTRKNWATKTLQNFTVRTLSCTFLFHCWIPSFFCLHYVRIRMSNTNFCSNTAFHPSISMDFESSDW